MRFKRKFNRWEYDYFCKVFFKLLNKVDKYGNYVYNHRSAFNYLNHKYNVTFEKPRYKNYDSFKNIKNR